MPNYTQILFDADNTLFDFTASSHLAFNDLMDHFGVKYDGDLYQVYKPINAKVWSQLEAKELDMDGVRTTRWQRFWEALELDHDSQLSNDIYLRQLVNHCFLLTDTIELLDHISNIAGVNQHVITNGMKEAQRPRISKLGIEEYFETITVSDEIGYAKPDTRFFDHVFNSISEHNKKQFLIVGDSLQSDIQGGLNYGVDTCWFNPNSKRNNSDIKPKFEISSLLELKEIVS